MLTVIGRLLLVPFAFVIAVLVSFFVLVTLGSERISHALAGREDVSLTAAMELFGQAVLLTSALTIVPALVLVIVGEVARIRSIIYYVVGGGLALVAVPVAAQLGQTGAVAAPSNTIWHVFATAGFLGGFAYWLIAGRSA